MVLDWAVSEFEFLPDYAAAFSFFGGEFEQFLEQFAVFFGLFYVSS